LWVFERQLKLSLALGYLSCRMTIIRLGDGGLFLHSPVRLDAAIGAALEELGPIRAIVAPSKAHHLFVADYVKASPRQAGSAHRSRRDDLPGRDGCATAVGG